MRIYLLLLSILLTQSCRTHEPSASVPLENQPTAGTQPLPEAAQKLWSEYVRQVQVGVQLQPNCVPIQLNPSQAAEAKGLFVFYHGFSGCPIQFINIAKKLAAQGYHVLLPLLPGQGRVPLSIDRARKIVVDDQSGMPENTKPYEQLTQTINAIAAAYPGQKIIGGLSGGGGQAMGTLVAAIDPKTKGNLWNRAILYVPFFRIPGIQGRLVGVVSNFLPQLYKGFGPACQDGQLSSDEPRNGMCDFNLKQLSAMVDYGATAAERSDELMLPIQYAGVEQDTASDNGAIIAAFVQTGSKDKHLCFYEKGVTHAVFYEADYLHPKDRPWVPEAETALIDWVTKGESFATNGPSFEPPQLPNANKHPLCKILAPLPKRYP